MALPATDNFNRADGAPGANWTGSVGNDLTIISNAIYPTVNSSDDSMYWSADTPSADQYAQARIVTGGTANCYPGVIVRASATDWVKGRSNKAASSWGIRWYNAGAFTAIGSDYSAGASTDDVIKLTAVGTTFTLYINGVARITGTNGSAPASGSCGIGLWSATSTDTEGALDDFEVGTITIDAVRNPEFVAAGAQTVTLTTGATLSPALPTGWAHNDLLVMIIAGRCNGSAITNTFSNTWTLAGERFREIGTGATDLYVGVYYRVAGASESSPTVTPDADFLTSGTTGGVSAQIAAFRYTAAVLDTTAATNDAAAAATWTPPSVTTNTPNALVLSCVATSDDNALNFNTANSFSLAMSGASYDTTTGSDHAVGMGYYVQATAGAVTMPVWNESLVGSDPWVGVTVAFKRKVSMPPYAKRPLYIWRSRNQ